jgi:DNA-binding transcriptional regulator YdaS (Cro superfamily)
MKFNQLIDHFGSQVAAADALGVTQPTLSNWKKRGRIPHLQQLRIEHVTRGKLRASPEILKARKLSRV